MAHVAKGIMKTLGWIIGSIVAGFLVTFVIAMYFEMQTESMPYPYVIWGFFSLLASIPIRRSINTRVKIRKPSSWEPPEQIRDRVINTPQFVGRFDREKGLLDSTARMVELDRSQIQKAFRGQPTNLNIIRLRGEILDQNGSPLEYIPVEIKGEESKWVGTIVEGDRIRVEGQIEDDGILHSKNAINYSTNSLVGERR